MPTAIPPTVFTQITQTNSSPETIAALLNEAETTYSSLRKTLHGNAKRVYPYWKTCQVCSVPYPCETREQVVRNKTCSPVCAGRAISQATTGQRRRPPRMAICQHCGKTFELLNGVRQRVYCSSSCNGKVRARHLVQFSANGKGKKRPGKGLSGAMNPAWKGGVTYFKTHGNYVGVKYVRCPDEYRSMARKDGYVMEHRLIVAQAIGRPLLRCEVVHHSNHDPADNRPANLLLFASNSAHKLYEHHGTPAPIWSL